MKIVARDVWRKEHTVEVSDLSWRPSVYGVVIEQDKVLLVSLYNRGYGLPGGGVQLDESFEQALVREMKEETGLTVEPVRMVECRDKFFVWKPGEPGQEVYHTVLAFYECRRVAGELSRDGLTSAEQTYMQQAEWVPLSEVDTMPQVGSVDIVPVIRNVARKEYENG